MPSYKKAGRLLAGLLALYTVLVLLHLGHVGTFWPPPRPELDRTHELGEFWPFSIYPMFSRAGRTWVRSHVREVPGTADPALWRTRGFDDLPGVPYALGQRGINQNDIANFIGKTRRWNARKVAGIRSVFEDDLRQKNLLLYRTTGTLQADSVAVVFEPFLLMAPDTTFFNPTLNYGTD